MTDYTDLMPYPALTPLGDARPNHVNLELLHRQLNANAMEINSARGGGQHGYLALLLSATDYNNIPNTQPWVATVHPGPAPMHAQAQPTGPQIAETNRQYKADLEEFQQATSIASILKKQLLEAVPNTYTALLSDRRFFYANVTVLQLLQHLDTTYGIVTADDLDENMNRLKAEWHPPVPLEELWKQVLDCKAFAADHDPFTDATAVRAVIANLTNAGVFTEALREWRKRPVAEHTWANVVADFTAADVERRRTVTTADLGYQRHQANKATDNKENTPIGANTNFAPIPLAYCWSHGLGPNTNHTSTSCNRPEPGHRKEATADNMLGGCCIIKRRNGERAVYVRPARRPGVPDTATAARAALAAAATLQAPAGTIA